MSLPPGHGQLPQTPPRRAAGASGHSAEELKSTPGNWKGTASRGRSDLEKPLTAVEVAPYVGMDIQGHDIVHFLTFLKYALKKTATSTAIDNTQPAVGDPQPAVNAATQPTSTAKDTQSTIPEPIFDPIRDKILNQCVNAVLPLCEEKEVQRLLMEYCKENGKKENILYPRFLQLFNHILSRLGSYVDGLPLKSPSNLSVSFERIDPKMMQQTHNLFRTSRSPDVIVVSEVSKQRVDAQSEKDQKVDTGGYSWMDALTTFEFKVLDTVLESPPKKYDNRLPETIPAKDQIRSMPSKKPVKPSTTGASSSSKSQHPSTGSIHLSSVPSSNKRTAEDEQPGSSSKKIKSSSNKVKEDLHKDRSVRSSSRPYPLEQNGLYASEILSRGIFTLHSINFFVIDDVVWIWWYDRQGAIQTTGINFIQHLPYFMVLLLVFQRFELRDWGIEPSLIANGGRNIKHNAQHLDAFDLEFPLSNVTVEVNPTKPIYDRLSLTGRATRILQGTSESTCRGRDGAVLSLKGEQLAVKAYWPEDIRPNEAEVILKARNLLSGTPEQSYLPTLVCWQDIEYATKDIRIAFGIPPGTWRLLRILIFIRLQPIDSFDDGSKFLKAWTECFKCHYQLWIKGIEHGDISLLNLMCRRDLENEIAGVLNDFDLITLRNITTGEITGQHGGERTGTIPFMAIDLLNKAYFDGKVERLYRHDMESFIWVFFWVCLYKSDNPEQTERLKGWLTADYDICRKEKREFLDNQPRHYPRKGYEGCWENVGEHLLDLIYRHQHRRFAQERRRQVIDEFTAEEHYGEAMKIIEDWDKKMNP